MAHRIAAATGNWLTAATWGVVDATSLSDSQAANTALTTSFVSSSSFTPGAITVDGIAIKIATRAASPTGTISVRLFDTVAAAAVAGTTVTINVSDIDDDQGTAGSGNEGCSIGWYFFAFAAPVTLSVNAHTVQASTSSASQVNLFSTATTNWSRMLRTTTTGAPSAGDSLFVLGLWTAAATKTDVVVTMNETAATDYGGASTTLASLGISKGGTLSYATTAASNFLLRLSGLLQVWLSGTLNIGTTGTPIPTDSTAVLEFDSATTGDFGLIVWGSLVVQGVARTSGKNVVYTLLTADASAGATSLTVQHDTGWRSADDIAISGTTRTSNDAEANALTGAAGASSLAVSALGAAHGGNATTGVQAEVILLSRNVSIRSVTSTAGSYLITEATSTVNIDWCLMRYMYGSTAAKAGFRVNNTSGSVNVDYTCWRDFPSASGRGISLASAINIAWTHVTAYMSSAVALVSFLETTTAQTGTLSLTDWASIADTNTSGTAHLNLAAVSNITLTRVYIANGAVAGVDITPTAGTTWAFSWTGGAVHGVTGTGGGIVLGGASAGYTFTDVNVWRMGSGGSGEGGVNVAAQLSDVTWTNCKFFGSSQQNIGVPTNGNLVRWRFVNCLLAGDSTFATPRGINILWASSVIDIRFENTTLGVATSIYVAHTSADIGSSATLSSLTGQVVLVNSTLGSATEFEASLLSALMGYSFYARQRKDGTTNTHEKVFPRIGTIAYETTTFRTASPAEKLTPSHASLKLKSSVKRIAVGVGQAATFNAYVRKDGSYAGNAPRLVLKANPALGVDNDTVLDTLSVGSGTWEQLTGSSSPVAEEDGVLEAYVDCDGTAGNVFIDDWSASVA